MGEAPVISTDTVTVTVRYFAAARAASGVDEESMTLPAPASVASVVGAAAAHYGDEFRRVLDRCSYLHNSVAVHDTADPVADSDQIDVLPPFAGG